MLNATITNVTKETLQEDGSQFLDVSINIAGSYPGTDAEGNAGDIEVNEVRKLGFPLDTPEETIVEGVKNFVAGFESDLLGAERNKINEAVQQQADETINNLTGKTISVTAEVAEPVEKE